MRQVILLCVLLLGITVHSQYRTPVKLKTITMKDSYKGSSVEAYKVMDGYSKTQTNYLPAEYQTDPKKKTFADHHYRGEWKTYDLDKHESDSTAVLNYYRTSDVAIYHGSKYPVYVSKKGKLFIWVTSSGGNTYKKYIN
jgi:hypothetical protein